jgi:hypothetical protein
MGVHYAPKLMNFRIAMTTMISEVYDAFRSVGVAEDKARKAAEALSSEAIATKGDIARLERSVQADISRVERELAVLKWMVSLVIAGVAAQIFKSFFG